MCSKGFYEVKWPFCWGIGKIMDKKLSTLKESNFKKVESKVEIFLEQREIAFLSPSKICENLNFSTKIQIFANFVGW